MNQQTDADSHGWRAQGQEWGPSAAGGRWGESSFAKKQHLSQVLQGRDKKATTGREVTGNSLRLRPHD